MTIIFLNGASSVGKSSVSKAIQELSPEPFLLTGIDSFGSMMPAQYDGFGKKASEGFRFIRREENGESVIDVMSGDLGNKITGVMPRVMKLMADSGFNLIIDEVLWGDKQLKIYLETLKDHKLYLIGVSCDFNVCIQRELSRGDREIGLARGQYDKVHKGYRPYDLQVDTTTNSSLKSARIILDFINNTPK